MLVDTGDGLNVTEAGPPDFYTLVLSEAPGEDVIVSLQDESEPDQVTVTAASLELTFTTGNWDTPQTVTVTAIDDEQIENDPHSTAIGHTVSGDPAYTGITVQDAAVSITENDCRA